MKLVAISYSPWSEKARWALDHHGLSYREERYLSVVDEPMMRLRLRRWRGKITIPILFATKEVLTDSLEIARYADRHGHGPPLFPNDEVEAWNDASERALAAGRVLATLRVSKQPEALLEHVPSSLDFLPRPIARRVALQGVNYLRTKYSFEAEQAAEAAIRQVLMELRGALREEEFLLGDFSYADIAMALALQFVAPVADRWIRLGPASRKCWTTPQLAEDFDDLVRWRDHIYATRRWAPRKTPTRLTADAREQ